MKKQLQKSLIKFTGFISVESIHDPIDELKTFCEDHGIEFCDTEIVESATECIECGSYVNDNSMYEDGICFKCYEEK